MMVRWGVVAALVLVLLPASLPRHGRAQEADSALASVLDRAQSAQRAGDFRSAAAAYARATSLSPETPELWSNRGVMEVLAGEDSYAIVSLKHALKLKEDMPPALLFLGKAYLESGKPNLALPYLRRAQTLQPNDPEVERTVGKASLALEHPQPALLAYSRATRADPGNADGWFGLGVASLRSIEADGSLLAAQRQSIWARALLADELYAQGRVVEASDTYKAVLADASSADRATLLRTLTWMKDSADALGLPPSAVEAIRNVTAQTQASAAHTVEPDCGRVPASLSAEPDVLLQKAACSFWSGDPGTAAELAGTALARTPDDPKALYWAIKANERMAVAALSRFEDLSTHSAANYVLVGNLFRLQRQPDQALAEYQKALAVDPHDASALRGAVLACIDSNRLPDAIAFDKTALTERPLDPELNLMMAEVLESQDPQNNEEQAYLLKAAGVPPELQPRLHYLLARVAVREGKTQEAIRQFQLALPGDKDGSMHYQLSRLYRETGNVAQAQQVLAEARALIRQRDANAAVALREGNNP